MIKRPTLVNADGSDLLSPAQQECVQLLEKVLEDARAGNVYSMVIVAVGPADFGTAMAGTDAPKMVLGLEVAKRNIIDRVSPPSAPRTVLHR